MMRGERPGHTLQPTALVHETWLRLEARATAEAVDRSQFRALAATAMRRVLVDAARRRRAEKRGGDPLRVEFDEALSASSGTLAELTALEDALRSLGAQDAFLERIVELRFFAGMSHPEIARVLEVPLRRVERGWALARAYLNRELSAEAS